MFKFIKYLKQFKKEVLLGPCFKLTEAIFELIVPLVMAKIIDVGIAQRDEIYVLKMGGVLLLLGITGLGCALVCQYFAAKASQGFGTVVRNELFRQINTLSHKEIDELGVSSLITRMTNDVNQLQVAVAMLIRLVVRAPFLVVGSTVMAMLLDWRLSCVFLVAAPLLALVLYTIMSRCIPFYRTIQKKLDTLSFITRENLTGIRVIRAFSKQSQEKIRFDKAANDQMKTSLSVGRISALLNPLTSVVVNLSVVAVVWFGGMRVDSGALTQGEVVAFVNYLSQILLALIVVANLVVIFTKASASASRINQVFDTHSTIADSASNNQDVLVSKPQTPKTINQAKKPNQPKIEYRGVSFSYHPKQETDEVLEKISFSIFPGETIGIIGGTGSGKSTLVNMIPRFYDATKGEILVDGLNVKEYSLAELRRKIGVVPQKAVLFSGSLRSNMLWQKEDATDEEIDSALNIAQAQEFVKKLPEGLDTTLMQGGKNLSGGQKQRLTIARALVGKPSVLILDDSSSALDFATDSGLRKALAEMVHSTKENNQIGVTVLMVSQRVNSVRNSDRIIVLEDGHIAGIGTHSQLLEGCPAYQEICQSQLQGG